jgi:putative phosphoesterase
MRIVVISDIHDNIVNLEKCLSWCAANKVASIICCGDVTNRDTLRDLSNGFTGNIYLVRGNMEIFRDEDAAEFNNIRYEGRVGRWEIGGRSIGACHEPYLIDKVLEKGDCDVIFYGHTHKPWEEHKSGTRLINPGTLGGMFSRATFAFWDTNKEELELKIMDRI